MKPAPFAYIRARSLTEVFDLIEEHGQDVRILAGGQSLLATLALRLSEPALLIDIGRLRELRFIEERNDSIQIGALTRHCELETSPLVAARLPLVTLAMPHVAHPAIRNRGTIGAAAAFVNAVNDALRPLGAAITEMPCTPERILRALKRVP